MDFRHVFPAAIFLCTIVAFSFTLSTPVSAAPDADLWSYWTKHDATSNRTLDHSLWKEWLEKWADREKNGIRRVRYAAVNKQGKKKLDRYLDHLQEIEVTNLSRDVQMAYWINLYNALTVDVILEHHPVDTIHDIDISPGWFSSGPWDKKLVTVEGKELTLNDIEHRILRPIWEDPRIHYVVNCASLGCPNLAPKPYTSDRLEQMLTEAAENYINHPRGARIENGNLIVSRIYSWYMEDFGNSEQAVINHLRSYASDAFKQELSSVSSIYAYRYDWTLNGVEQEWDPSE